MPKSVFKVRNRDDGSYREAGRNPARSSAEGKTWRELYHVKNYLKQFFHWSDSITERMNKVGNVEVVEFELEEKRVIPVEDLLNA